MRLRREGGTRGWGGEKKKTKRKAVVDTIEIILVDVNTG